MSLRLTSVDIVKSEGMVGVELAGVRLLVVAAGDGVQVLSGGCPHRGGPLIDGFVACGVLVCPWHRSIFSLENGTPLSGPCHRPLRIFASHVQDGDVYLEERL